MEALVELGWNDPHGERTQPTIMIVCFAVLA